MKEFRIIAKMDIKDDYLVNSRMLEGLRVIGNPKEFMDKYYKFGVDEFILHDVTASYIGRNTLYGKLKKITDEIFLPITLGGGVKNLDDIKQILNCGADKVFLNTGILENPNFAKKAINIYGSSTISANVVITKSNDKYYILKNHGRDNQNNLEPIDWIKFLDDIGIGEIILTFAHKDGTKEGFDLRFLDTMQSNISASIILNGGASDINSIKKITKYSFVNGVAISTLFHDMISKKQSFKSLKKIDKAKFDSIKNSSTKSGKTYNIIKTLKNELSKKGIQVRK